jgi:DNA-binding GntR family transcriptional regulator
MLTISSLVSRLLARHWPEPRSSRPTMPAAQDLPAAATDTTAVDTIVRLPPLRLDRSRQAAPQVADALREAIVAVDIVPGTVLSRTDLAEHYGVSQTPIRDALIRLGDEGLVDIYPQHATLVSRIDITSAQQAHFLRRALELEIVRKLAGLGVGVGEAAAAEALLKRLRAALRRQQAALEPHDLHEFAEADRSFHRELYVAADLAPLWDLVRSRSGHIDRLRSLHLPAQGKAEAVLRDHEAIVAALEAQSPAQAEAALREHLSGTLSFIDEICARYPDYVRR